MKQPTAVLKGPYTEVALLKSCCSSADTVEELLPSAAHHSLNWVFIFKCSWSKVEPY